MLLTLTSTVPGLKPSRRPIVECLLNTSALQRAEKVWMLKEDAGSGRGGGHALVSEFHSCVNRAGTDTARQKVGAQETLRE